MTQFWKLLKTLFIYIYFDVGSIRKTCYLLLIRKASPSLEYIVESISALMTFNFKKPAVAGDLSGC